MTRKQLAISGLVVISFGIIATYVTELIFDDLKSAVIAGLVVSLYALLFELRLAIQSAREDMRNDVTLSSERLSAILAIQKDVYDNEWLRKTLGLIIELRKFSENQSHDLRRVEDIISEAIRRAREQIGTPHKIVTGRDELDRIYRLNNCLQEATRYVRAVTFDARDYLNEFWSAAFLNEYVESNAEAIKRGVIIERIFIVDQQVISDVNNPKHKKLKELLRRLKRCGNAMHLFTLAIQDIPEECSNSDNSFLVADDHVTSESSGKSDGVSIEGYVCYGDKDNVRPLLNRFEVLRSIAQPA